MQPNAIGRYSILGELGRGSTAVVYFADDPFNDRKVAIKVENVVKLGRPEEDARLRKLFLNEASLAGKLHHPNIVGVYDAVMDEATRYIVMEYLPRGSLSRYCVESNLLPVSQLIPIMFKCCHALNYATQHGVVHRDVKPANMLLDERSEAKISDFGAALIFHSTHTQVSGLVGSPAYMAPERINGDDASVQSDIYSLGVSMYQLLTGRLPFDSQSSMSLMRKILRDEPVPITMLRPSIPPPLMDIVRRAMHRDPVARYRNWVDVAKALAEVFPKLEALDDEINATEKINQLRDLEFFDWFEDVELWELLRTAVWEHYEQGQSMVQEGARTRTYYVIASGCLNVTKNGNVVRTLKPSDCFGEASTLGGPRVEAEPMATLTAATEVDIVKIQADQLDLLSEGCQLRFNKAFLHALLDRLSQPSGQSR
jgi:eukaryotic-like serine/threonine-protein kinase